MRRSMTVLATAALIATGCGAEPGEQEAGMESIRGTVIYLERMALPPGAEVAVELQDVSLADAPARVLAATRFEAEGGPPYPFELTYDPAAIDQRMRYALRATITLGDELLFTTDTHHPAFGTEEHELRVRRVGASTDADAGDGSGLTGKDWSLRILEGEEVPPLSDGRRPYIHFGADGRVHGFAGCNRMTGGYRIEAGQLELSQVAMTRMACPEGMDTEQRLGRALDRVTGYDIDGDRLVLSDSEGKPVTVFETGN